MKIHTHHAFNPAEGPSPGGSASQNAIQAWLAAQAAGAAGGVAATSGVGDTDDQQWSITLEAMGDLAAIHMAILKGNVGLALHYANDLLKNCAGKATPEMNTVITAMMADFQLSPDRTLVTDINFKQFTYDWTESTDSKPPAVGGIEQIYANVLTNKSLANLTITGDNAVNGAMFFLFLSDSMLCKTVTMDKNNPRMFNGYDLSTYIWGNSAGGSYSGPMYGMMYLQDMLPMLVGSAFYQKDVNGVGPSGYNKFQLDLHNFISLFPDKSDLDNAYQGGTEPDFSGYLQATGKLDRLLTDYPATQPSNATFPPQEWIDTMKGPPYNFTDATIAYYFNPSHNAFGEPCDLSQFFEILASGSFDDFISPGPFLQ